MRERKRVWLIHSILAAALISGIPQIHAEASNAPTTKKTEYGLYLGVSRFTLHINPSADYTMTTSFLSGLAFGVNLSIPLNRFLCLQPELWMIDKGAAHSLSIPDFEYGDLTGLVALTYYEVPLTLKFIPFPGARVSPYLLAGGYMAGLGSATVEFQSAELPKIIERPENADSTDFGCLGGAGIRYRLNGFSLSAEYRYSLGLHNIDIPLGNDLPTFSFRNRGHQFLLNIVFALK